MRCCAAFVLPGANTRRGVSTALWASALACVLGCGSPTPLRVDVPFETGMNSLLVALESGGAIAVHAFETRDEARALRTFQASKSERELQITALYYARPLADLLLAPGPVPMAPQSRRSLPPFDLGFVQTLRRGGADARSSISSFEDERVTVELRAVRLPPICRNLVLRTFLLPDAGSVAGTVPLTATSALVIAADARDTSALFYEVDADGPKLLPFEIPGFLPLSASLAPSGELYLLGERASDGAPEFRVGTLAAGFRALPLPLGAPAGPPDIAHDDSEPGAIYMLDTAGRVERFDGAAWSIFGEPPSVGSLLAWAGPEELIVEDASGRSLLRVDRTGATVEFRMPLHASIDGQSNVNYLTALRWISGFGVVAGTHVQGIYRRAPSTDTWDTVKPTRKLLTGDIYSLAGYRGGLVHGGEEPLISQYFPGSEPCDGVMIEFGWSLRSLAALEADLLVGTLHFSGQLMVAVLRDLSGDAP